MICSDLIYLTLRAGEFLLSATVTGMVGYYLHHQKDQSGWTRKRFYYTEGVAAFGALYSLIFFLPFTRVLVHWPADLLLCILFMAAFGLLSSFIMKHDCGSASNLHDIVVSTGTCREWKVDLACCFVAGVLFLVSGLLGMWMAQKRRTKHQHAGNTTINIVTNDKPHGRNKWYRSSHV